jgi:adenosylcobyric acid synthase
MRQSGQRNPDFTMNEPSTPSLMVQGCTSDAGKTVLVAASVASCTAGACASRPFKPQNMALNSAVTIDGGEIGRAQALQALAAGVPAHSDFNPVLLKPATDQRAQVIIHGKAMLDLDARDYHAYKPRAMKAVLESWQRLCAQYDCLLVEGAGSPAEINLRDRDIANMGFAEAVDCPVILIADIDRGGVFAHLVRHPRPALAVRAGARQGLRHQPLSRRHRPARKRPALARRNAPANRCSASCPICTASTSTPRMRCRAPPRRKRRRRLRVVAPAYPRISNHNDLDPLRFHPEVDFRFVGPHDAPPPCDLIVLPGSKGGAGRPHLAACAGLGRRRSAATCATAAS